MHRLVSWLCIVTDRNDLKISKVVSCYYHDTVITSPFVSDGLSVLYSGGILLQSCHLSRENMQVSSLYLLRGCP